MEAYRQWASDRAEAFPGEVRLGFVAGFLTALEEGERVVKARWRFRAAVAAYVSVPPDQGSFEAQVRFNEAITREFNESRDELEAALAALEASIG